MSGTADTPGVPRPKENPERLVLRGKPAPVVRFRRGLIAGLTGTFAVTLIALSWLALEPQRSGTAGLASNSDEPARVARTDALANVPRTYGDVPRLGPPLPGDLGRAILAQQRSLDAGQPSAIPPAAPDPALSAAEADRERVLAARQAARTSGLLVQLEGPRSSAPSVEPSSPEAGSLIPAGEPAASSSTAPASQQRKIDFARSSDGEENPHGLVAAPSPWTLSAGTVIPANLITGVDSDLPGTVLAQVSENVRDSATGRTVLIPQGARLVGRYDCAVAYGQRRALLVWTRIVFPDATSLELDKMPATDAAGYAGLEDRVDSHAWQLIKGIGLSTLLGASTQLSIGGGGELVRAIRESTQQNAAHAGDQITSRNLDVQPTIRIRPGWPVRALLNKDVVLKPWRG